MKRRRFLTTIGAAVAALFVPKPAAEPIFALGPGGYLGFVHPANVRDIDLLRGEIGRYESVRFIESGPVDAVHTWNVDVL